MSALSSKEFLSGSVSLILRLYDHYEEQRRLADVICRDSRSLFRPWPQKVRKSGACGKDSESSPQEVQHDLQMQASQHFKEDDILEKEKAELALLDNILAKAKKAREVQAKLEEMKPAQSNIKSSRPSKPQPLGKDTYQPLKTSTKENVKLVPNAGKTTKNPANNRHSYAQKVTKSATSKYVPAHTTAPFKTDSNMHKKKLKSRPRSADRVSAGRTVEQQQVSVKSRPVQRTSDAPRDNGEVPIPRLPPIENTQVPSVNSEKVDLCVSYSCNSGDAETRDPSQTGVTSCKNKAEPQAVTRQQALNADEKPIQKTEFLLSRDGKNLSLPGKFKKLLHANMKLREKMGSVCPMSTDRSTSSHAQQFFRKFSDVLSTSKDRYVQLHRSIVELENDYKSVFDLLGGTELDCLSEETCAKDVLKAKVILADVLSRFYSMEEEYQHIQRGLKAARSKNVLSSITPVSIEKYREGTDTQEFSVQRNESLGHLEHIQYTSMKQLTRYASLQSHVDVLQVEKKILDNVAPEILDYLKEANPGDSGFSEVYRSSYAMLCSSGRSFPTMVRDTISSEDSDD